MPEEQSIIKEVGAVTQHQVSKELSEHSQDLSDIEMPFRVENVTMMSPGTWNQKEYRPDEIRQAYQRTDWDDPEVRALFNEHDDEDSRHWIGEIKNPRMSGDELVADMDIVTMDEARKVAYGARFGISPKVSGIDRADVMRNFGYDNFSLVLDPAVKTTYLNSEHNTDDEDESTQGVKNVMVKTNMSEEDQTKELSSEDKAKVEEIVSTVENSDVEELANVIAPFVGDASAEQLQPHIESVVENAEDDEYEDKDKEMDGHEDDEEMRDMEEIARRAAEQVATEIMGDEDGDDDGGDEQSLSVDEIADKVAEKVQIENSDDEDEEDDSSDEVDALKEELSEIKEQLSQDEEDDKTTIENKTPNPGSESTGTDGASSEKDIQEMSDKEIDTGAAKYLLRKQSRSI